MPLGSVVLATPAVPVNLNNLSPKLFREVYQGDCAVNEYMVYLATREVPKEVLEHLRRPS